MHSFTQLLRRASSRGSHNTPNNIEEAKDEPEFNTIVRNKSKMTDQAASRPSELQSSFP
jgi:hypothetical protein